MGAICNALLILTSSIAIMLPPAADFKLQEAFAAIYVQMPRLVVSSFIAYFVSEFVNSYIMSKMKIWSKAENFGFRAIASTAMAQIIDSSLYFCLAFAGVLPNQLIMKLILTAWFLKVCYEIVALPFTTVFVGLLKKWEGIEHFDRQKLVLLKF